MRILDIINASWAITPEMLTEIQSIYARHLRGDKIDLAGIEARLGAPLNNSAKGYEVVDGVAVLAIDGVIAKRMNLFLKISGGTSTELIGSDFESALADRTVEAIVLDIDSPGGTVDGTMELAAQIYEARGIKPVVALANGTMASAAYWIGSAADTINISSETTITGSIGVVTQHMDVSRAEEKAGVKTTEIYAGKYKRISSQYEPLSDAGRKAIQDGVDYVYGVFVDDVAKHRGTDSADVLGRMADARLFHGSQAITAGLVDGVATLSATIEQARALARSSKLSGTGAIAAQSTTEDLMDLKTLKENHPELVEAITTEAQASMAEQITAAKAEGLELGGNNERDRIADVRAQAIAGHESLVEQLAFDGKSSGSDAAKAIIAAEKNLRSQAAQNLQNEAPALVPNADGGNGQDQLKMSRADFNKLEPVEQAAQIKNGIALVD